MTSSGILKACAAPLARLEKTLWLKEVPDSLRSFLSRLCQAKLTKCAVSTHPPPCPCRTGPQA
eukprot:12257528-Alexandrium_andersonii.AAC.1